MTAPNPIAPDDTAALPPIADAWAIGDRVRFDCPGAYHEEAGTVVEIGGTPKMRVYFVRMDTPKLNLPESGRVPTTGELLRRVEEGT